MKTKKLVAHIIQTNTVEPTTGVTTFTTEEYDQLMALPWRGNGNNQSFANTIGIITSNCNTTQYGSHSTLYWIVDSGATDHISKSPLTQNKFDTNHDFVELPDGGEAEIKSTGSIKLSHNLILDGVLHVPKFRVNLLSISKLTQALRCNVIFYPDFHVVFTKKMIGLDKQHNGLYYLTPNQNPHLAQCQLYLKNLASTAGASIIQK